MALVSISKAAQLAGLSRTQIYRGYIEKGKLSTVTVDDRPPRIDTSELLRVFGELKGSDSHSTATGHNEPSRPVTISKSDTEAAILRQKVKHLEELLQERDKRLQEKDERLREKDERITDLRQTIRLIEHRQPVTADPSAEAEARPILTPQTSEPKQVEQYRDEPIPEEVEPMARPTASAQSHHNQPPSASQITADTAQVKRPGFFSRLFGRG